MNQTVDSYVINLFLLFNQYTNKNVCFRYPDIRTTLDITADEERCRISAYDNVELDRRAPRAPPSEISEITEFSDPWAEPNQVITETDESYAEAVTPHKMKCASINRSRSFRDRLDPLLCKFIILFINVK